MRGVAPPPPKKKKKTHTHTQKQHRNLLYSFGWIISPLFDQFPLSRICFSSITILNTGAKYSYLIDAVTKSKLIFIFGKIKSKLKNVSYLPILQYFNVCLICLKMQMTSPVAYALKPPCCSG